MGDKSVLTVVDFVYHQPAGQAFQQIPHRFNCILESDEEVYHRRTKATEEWSKLEYGWIESPSMIKVVNEAKDNTEGSTLELFYRVDEDPSFDMTNNGWIIPPGECMRGRPTRPGLLAIRSQQGITKYSIYAIPK